MVPPPWIMRSPSITVPAADRAPAPGHTPAGHPGTGRYSTNYCTCNTSIQPRSAPRPLPAESTARRRRQWAARSKDAAHTRVPSAPEEAEAAARDGGRDRAWDRIRGRHREADHQDARADAPRGGAPGADHRRTAIRLPASGRRLAVRHRGDRRHEARHRDEPRQPTCQPWKIPPDTARPAPTPASPSRPAQPKPVGTDRFAS